MGWAGGGGGGGGGGPADARSCTIQKKSDCSSVIDYVKIQTTMSSRDETRNHYVLLVGDGKNFKKGANLTVGKRVRLARTLQEAKTVQKAEGYWAVASKGSQSSQIFIHGARSGDILWFVRSKDTKSGIPAGTVVAVAELVIVRNNRTFTHLEMGWTDDGGDCASEVIYTNCISLERCNFRIETSGKSLGPKTVRQYTKESKITTELPAEYVNIQKFKNAKDLN